MKKYQIFFYLKIFLFFGYKIFNIFEYACFCNGVANRFAASDLGLHSFVRPVDPLKIILDPPLIIFFQN